MKARATVQDDLDRLLADDGTPASQLILRWAKKVVRRPGFSGSELEDVIQSITLAVIRSFPSFDPALASEITFVARIAERAAVSIVRAQRAERRDRRREWRSLNEAIRDSDGCSTERAQTISQDAASAHTQRRSRSDQEMWELRCDVAAVLERLPADLREIATRLMKKCEFAVARELQCSRRSLARDREKLRVIFEDAELNRYLRIGAQSHSASRM